MTQLVTACFIIYKLCIKAVAEELDTKSIAKIVEAERVVFEVVVLDKVDKYREIA